MYEPDPAARGPGGAEKGSAGRRVGAHAFSMGAFITTTEATSERACSASPLVSECCAFALA